MERGQIGVEARHRVLFVWEGAVARLPDRRAVQSLEWVKRRAGLYDAAVGYWEPIPRALNLMWSFLARTPYRVDVVVTTRPPEFAEAVERLCDKENWPVYKVHCTSAEKLGRGLVGMPDVYRVYYGLEEQRWAFGPHGVFFGPDTPAGIF